ncbi:MAG: Dabb family protein [Microgenomates group bacterium]
MIHHIVLFKFYENTAPEKIQKLADALEILSKKISGITHYVWGTSMSIEHLEKGYTHGFIMTFKNAQSRDDYVPHPLSKELIKKFIDPICDKGIAFDIEE